MDAIKKLEILSGDSQYDLACACGTNKNDRRKRGSDGRWLYPVPLPGGGYSVLLKTLLSNACSNDCAYCPLRSDSNVRRCALRPEEIARLAMNYFEKSNVFGLFLSSGVIDTPDRTMEKINAVAAILRRKYAFRGYIHLKVIPGASRNAIDEALSLASAVSLNIETPGEKYFKLLSRSKRYISDIIEPVKYLSARTAPGEKYSRIKLSTQFIVGASGESDSEIVKYVWGLYRRLNFRRVYFSSYQRGMGRSDIPGESSFGLDGDSAFMREHRLYQADFLIRKYGFDREEICFESDGNFSLEKDPKEVWAERHPEFFPVNINTADRDLLLRVPGLGHVSVNRIIKSRKLHLIRDLESVKVKGLRREKAMKFVCT